MPSRIVRQAILDSERYHALSAEAKVAFYELILCADDYGLVCMSSLYLRRHTTVLGNGAADGKIINELAVHDMLRMYQVKGAAFAYITRFKNHPRAVKPSWPLPPDDLGGKEIKELIQKVLSTRNARAKHLQASVAITETETETETEVHHSVVTSFPRTTAGGSEPGETTPAPASSPAPPRKGNGKGNGQDHDPPPKPKPHKPKPIEFDPKRIDWQGITDAHIAAWEEAYPACNLRAELAKAAVWASANPANRKSNWERFLTNWLARSQDRSPPRTSP